ncbi:hypothetical protein L1049_027643 [Liquidambar formosana]|uniref:Cyclin-like domain-containing protein n=1 Tax=Liquidambar formosana TaxID=63359 RepID=A0AAP0RIB3_LIQFO
METEYSRDCETLTQVVFDHAAGDTFCLGCGLVLDSHSIEETAEWRIFTDDSRDKDPIRASAHHNPLLASGGLSTVISKPKGASGYLLPSRHARRQNYGFNSDRSLIQGFKLIDIMSDRIEPMKHTRGWKIKNLLRGRNQDAIVAACLYIACRQEEKPRTVKEICSVANGPTVKETMRTIEYIKKLETEMGNSMNTGVTHAGDYMRRFCSQLGMTNQAVKAALEAAEKCEELDIRRAAASVTAAIIYMITQLPDEKKLLKDISLVTTVAEGTIRKAYKELCPYASRIIPSWFAKEEDLRSLHNPLNHLH